ncbi:MAG TPA: UbiA family prenyltransferase [Candidatus Elarobacter sp.]|jgi:4-hydroxybenzoate polyprenyltransferase
MRLLVRPWAWWHNKVPLSVILVVLLADGGRFTFGVFAALVLVVVAVCAVGNYGYALNDLYDVDEDARAGRANAVTAAGPAGMRLISALSALCALLAATAAAGAIAGALTLVELALPAAYSIPPLRIKERRWLGVASDALAAHVYPAVLALLAAAHWSLRPVPPVLWCAALAWSLAAGLRGILSHQLHTAERDAGAGLATVVHAAGARRLERVVVIVLLPVEVAAFAVALFCCDAGPVLWAGVLAYLAYEAYKTVSGTARGFTFRPQGQRYLPFLEESFYKVWGPLVLPLDAACADLAYLVLAPVYALLFRAHLAVELARIRALVVSARSPRAPATEPGDRSSAGS